MSMKRNLERIALLAVLGSVAVASSAYVLLRDKYIPSKHVPVGTICSGYFPGSETDIAKRNRGVRRIVTKDLDGDGFADQGMQFNNGAVYLQNGNPTTNPNQEYSRVYSPDSEPLEEYPDMSPDASKKKQNLRQKLAELGIVLE